MSAQIKTPTIAMDVSIPVGLIFKTITPFGKWLDRLACGPKIIGKLAAVLAVSLPIYLKASEEKAD